MNPVFIWLIVFGLAPFMAGLGYGYATRPRPTPDPVSPPSA